MQPEQARGGAQPICCICGKALRPRHGKPPETTYSFKTFLAEHGFIDRSYGRDKAHPTCIVEWAKWPKRESRV
jgi:hypothetical protein